MPGLGACVEHVVHLSWLVARAFRESICMHSSTLRLCMFTRLSVRLVATMNLLCLLCLRCSPGA